MLVGQEDTSLRGQSSHAAKALKVTAEAVPYPKQKKL